MPHRTEIQIRDPFVLPLFSERRYALFGTTDINSWNGVAVGFDVYLSVGESLEEWEGPFPAFRPSPDFWATENFWAPEVHKWRGQYYMFASFKSPNTCRGTQVLVADHPIGPYIPHSPTPITPSNWECLDGTLFVDDTGKPWMVFCHEWLQTTDGEMCAVPLADDLSQAIGEPRLLFTASTAQWASPLSYKEQITNAYITDGPFLYRTSVGSLLMLWSTKGKEGYCMGIATSENGGLAGPWIQAENPLFAKDGGHGMLFQAFDDTLYVTLHQPNQTPYERFFFFPIQEQDGTLTLV